MPQPSSHHFVLTSPRRKNPAFDFVEPVLARHTENKFSSVLAYSRLSRKNRYFVRKRKLLVNENENQNQKSITNNH